MTPSRMSDLTHIAPDPIYEAPSLQTHHPETHDRCTRQGRTTNNTTIARLKTEESSLASREVLLLPIQASLASAHRRASQGVRRATVKRTGTQMAGTCAEAVKPRCSGSMPVNVSALFGGTLYITHTLPHGSPSRAERGRKTTGKETRKNWKGDFSLLCGLGP